ncbi:hypothetical protein [Devosia enhydra]|nr:hypothetical protein [Devosia enhydra]
MFLDDLAEETTLLHCPALGIDFDQDGSAGLLYVDALHIPLGAA